MLFSAAIRFPRGASRSADSSMLLDLVLYTAQEEIYEPIIKEFEAPT